MKCSIVALLGVLIVNSADGRRNNVSRREEKLDVDEPAVLQRQYPMCASKLDELGLTLNDLKLTDEEVSALFAPSDCAGPESAESFDKHTSQVVHDYFLRMTLVGQPDPRGPTLYTPPAQKAVLETMKMLATRLLRKGTKEPDLEFLTIVFRGIDVEDTGSLTTAVVGLAARIFNRGGNDSQYRSKDVTTKPHNLSSWGTDRATIESYNGLTYEDGEGKAMKALELSSTVFAPTNALGLTNKTSFVYKLPPKGIEHELQKIIDAFKRITSAKVDLSTMEVFELAEKWIRDFVILHPFTDANGRTARVALNIMLLMNGISPVVMARQDDDMTSSEQEFREKVCEGMAYAKGLFLSLPGLKQNMMRSTPGKMRCCSAPYALETYLLGSGTPWCVTIPESLDCDEYSKLTQSARYLPWTRELEGCGAKFMKINQTKGITEDNTETVYYDSYSYIFSPSGKAC